MRNILLMLVVLVGAARVEASAPPEQADPATLARVDASGPPLLSVGQPAEVLVVVTATGSARTPSHLELDFPTRLAISPPDGLTVPSPALDRTGAAKLDRKEIRFRVPVTATRAGTHELKARISFAVCQEEPKTGATVFCIPQRRDLVISLVAR